MSNFTLKWIPETFFTKKVTLPGLLYISFVLNLISIFPSIFSEGKKII